MHLPVETPEPRSRGIRWWPACLVVFFAAAAVCWYQYFDDLDQQHRNIKTAEVVVAAIGLLLIWVVLFSRLKWGTRLICVGGVFVLLGLAAATLRIRGVTGDLVPVLEWRWATAEPPPLPLAGSASRRDPGDSRAEEEDLKSSAGIPAEQNYPQIYGPDRNGQLPGPLLARDWETQPPDELWRQAIGAGWSGFAIAGHSAITMEQRGEQELVTCYDLHTGELIWAHGDDARYETTIAGVGPRSVPTIAGDRVFTVGATGILNCLDLYDGSVRWATNIMVENEGRPPEWGVSGSPLVDGERVVVSAGGKDGRAVVAYDIATGDPVWAGGDSSAHYSSPLLAEFEGGRQIVIFNNAISGHDADTGAVLWSHPWRGGHPHICPPMPLEGDRVLVSSGYGTGAAMLQVAQDSNGAWAVAALWETNRLKSKFANFVVHEGFIYGLDDGIMVCLEAASGERRWKRGRYGHGQLLLVGDTVLVMSEHGEVILVEPDSERHQELTRFRALSGKTWNPPALAGRFLVVRNDQEAACFRLPVR